MAVREAGDWEGWLKFFLRGVGESAEEATATARAIVDLRERHRVLSQQGGLGVNGLRVLDLLFQHPLVNVNLVRDQLNMAWVTANKLVERLQALHLLEETSGGRRNRVYRYSPYLALFAEPEEQERETAVVQTREGEPRPELAVQTEGRTARRRGIDDEPGRPSL